MIVAGKTIRGRVEREIRLNGRFGQRFNLKMKQADELMIELGYLGYDYLTISSIDRWKERRSSDQPIPF